MPVRIRIVKGPQDLAKEINRHKGALNDQVYVREQRLEQHGEKANELLEALHKLYVDIKTHFEKKMANRAIVLNNRVVEAKAALESCK